MPGDDELMRSVQITFVVQTDRHSKIPDIARASGAVWKDLDRFLQVVAPRGFLPTLHDVIVRWAPTATTTGPDTTWWVWTGDEEENDLPSMSSSMEIMITAGQLRRLIAEAEDKPKEDR